MCTSMHIHVHVQRQNPVDFNMSVQWCLHICIIRSRVLSSFSSVSTDRLSEAGYGVGLRLLELLFHRERNGRRERNIINILRFIQSSVWRTLFGKPADGLQKCTERSNEYYIYDNEPITNRFVSVPKDMGQFNCAAYVAGIVNGFLDGAEFVSFSVFLCLCVLCNV